MKRVLRTARVCASILPLALLCPAPSIAASAAGVATATVVAPIAISSTGNLSFGSFSVNAAGSVEIDADGHRSSTGGVALATGSAYTAATFVVTGTGAATYAIALPADAAVNVQDDAGNTMVVRAFASDPSGYGVLGDGAATVHVYATLSVGSRQEPGAYSGSFPVTVEYN